MSVHLIYFDCQTQLLIKEGKKSNLTLKYTSNLTRIPKL